jgi:hypothetical protein
VRPYWLFLVCEFARSSDSALAASVRVFVAMMLILRRCSNSQLFPFYAIPDGNIRLAGERRFVKRCCLLPSVVGATARLSTPLAG